jgi:pyruvate/2-oxoglutarate/acetoin dehydrogenase E1 component
VISTMLMADRTLQAAELLASDGLSVEVIELRWLRPLDLTTVIDSVLKTGRLLVVEEQVHAAGWGATVISELTLRGVEMARPSALSLADDILIPYSPPLEDEIVPSVNRIAEHIRSLLA